MIFFRPPGHPNAEKRPLNPKKHTSTPYSDECHLFLGNNFQIMFLCPPPPQHLRGSKTSGVWESLDRRKSSFASSRPEVFSWQKWCPKRPRWEIFVFFGIGTLSPTIMVQWKITLNERTLILQGRIFHWTMIMGRRVNPFKLCVCCFISDLFVWVFLSSYHGKINRLYKIHH